MIRDRAQKQMALRYVVSRRWFPQVEVDVSAYVTIGETAYTITDLDVLAALPDELLGYRSVIVDCKTKKSESPVNRALWLRGVMERVDADRGICLLQRSSIETDHRYTANRLGITLLTEGEFEVFAEATDGSLDSDVGAVGDLDVWERYWDIPNRYGKLERAINFSGSGYWMASAPNEACRKTLRLLRDLRPELDPDKAEHLTVVGDLVALFLHSLASVTAAIFSGYLQPERREELSEALLIFLYGGREAYEHRNQLRRMIVKDRQTHEGNIDLSLPNWSKFVKLVRQALDVPIEITHAPLIMREVGLAYLDDSEEIEFASRLADESPQGARMAFLGMHYACQATGLPPEFADILGEALVAVQ